MSGHPATQLSGWLVEAVPELATAVAAHGDRIEAAVAEVFQRGRRAWPQLSVDEHSLVAAVANAVRDADDVATAIGELQAEDLFLAQACALGAPAALAAFATKCDVVLIGSIRKLGVRQDVLDDLIQQVRARLFVADASPPRISTYSGRAGLNVWVSTIATRAALGHLRAQRPNVQEDLEQLPDLHADPELDHFRRMYHAEFKDAFESAFATLDVRQRNVLRHHFVDGLTVEEIGAIYGVHKSSAARWVDAARSVLSKRTRAAFQQRLRARPEDVDSILRALQSQIDLSLHRVLGDKLP